MDFQVRTLTYGTDDLTWLASPKNLRKYPATIATNHLVESVHFPDGYVKRGTVLGFFTAGAEQDLFTPWKQDGLNGEQTIAGIVFSGFRVRKNEDGTLVSTKTTGSILLPESGVHIISAKLPAGVLADDTTANTATDAELETAGFTAVALGV